jgi:hypothetical protein
LDYAIPREQLEAANPHHHNGSHAAFAQLEKQAKELFTDLLNSGEGGELLLYALSEKILKLPQIMCKMAIKSSSKMHFHGADGIHAGVSEDGKLVIYWGESKIHKTPSGAIASCCESLSGFIQAGSLFDDEAGNDFQLLFRQPNIPNNQPELRKAIVSYFDSTQSNAFDFETRAVALVGFDFNQYTLENIDNGKIKQEIEKKITAWKALIQTHCAKSNLENFSMHFFVLPFPSVKCFRDEMFLSLGIPNVK